MPERRTGGRNRAGLAECLIDTITNAEWAYFAKNGTDATVFALAVARAHTGRRVVLRAGGAYHGWAPVWQAEGRPGTGRGQHARARSDQQEEDGEREGQHHKQPAWRGRRSSPLSGAGA